MEKVVATLFCILLIITIAVGGYLSYSEYAQAKSLINKTCTLGKFNKKILITDVTDSVYKVTFNLANVQVAVDPDLLSDCK